MSPFRKSLLAQSFAPMASDVFPFKGAKETAREWRVSVAEMRTRLRFEVVCDTEPLIALSRVCQGLPTMLDGSVPISFQWCLVDYTASKGNRTAIARNSEKVCALRSLCARPHNGPTRPTRAGRLAEASVDPTEVRKPAVSGSGHLCSAKVG